ncbi:MAG: PHP domain-containing protein [Candidatus Thorarchaeota archaeon]
MPLKLDIHIHTINSGDSKIIPKAVPEKIKSKGLDGIALTEHNKLFKYDLQGIIVLPGIEISTKRGHLLAIGLDENIKKGMSMDWTIKEVKRHNGIAIIAHPYSISARADLNSLNMKPDAIETLNARIMFCKISSKLAKRKANQLMLPTTGGSDSHILDTIGDAYTTVYAKSRSIEDILEAFRKGNIEAGGRCSSIKNKAKGRVGSITRKIRNIM